MDQKKMNKFEIICMYLASYFKESDGNYAFLNDTLKDKWVCWGEMEYYNKFGINFCKEGWLTDIAFDEDNPVMVEITRQMDEFGVAGAKLFKTLLDLGMIPTESDNNDTTRYTISTKS